MTNEVVAADDVFWITSGGSRKTSELVKLGAYDWVNHLITNTLFPVKESVPLNRVVKLIKFDHDPTSEDVLVAFERQNLKRPIYEDALAFGIQHYEAGVVVAFLHEPVLVNGTRRVLVLGGRNGRRIGLRHFDEKWSDVHFFAGIGK